MKKIRIEIGENLARIIALIAILAFFIIAQIF